MARMGDPTTDFVAMLDLEPHGPDVWVGTGPRYPWGGLYGGQIVAQALRAAAHTVDPQFRVHSLHAYFIRRGDHTEPVRYEVDRVRNGRSFVTRTVTARQAVGAILSVSVSFQVDEEAPEVQTAELPEAPGQPMLADAELPAMIEFLLVNERVLPDAVAALPASERINHTLLAINYGAILILLAVLVGPGGVSLLS